jgi:tellurite resistance protein TerC
MIFFSFAEYWILYVGFAFFVLLMLALDLGVFHKKIHTVSVKEATFWTALWIALAFAFNIGFFFYSKNKFLGIENFETLYGLSADQMAKNLSFEFLTGFLIEKTLAIDNIFIFALVFSFFKIPKLYQHRVLFWGILGALFFRAVFIALGSVLMEYKIIVIIFGLLLMFTGVKMVIKSSSEDSLEKNIFIRLLKKFFNVYPKIDDHKFFKKINGKQFVTPLFLALVFIEVSDIIFAIDSVPAIFSITNEPLIVFTSNIFAIMGLRSMYFMLIGALDKFYYIKYGLAGVLVFVGLKMVYLNEHFGGKFPISWSLGIIFTMIASSIIYSLFVTHGKKVVQ